MDLKNLGINPQHLYTLDSLAELLGLTKRTLQQKASSGEIKAVKKFGRWYILGEWVIEAILEEEK